MQTELLKRYEKHPLGAAIQAIETTEKLDNIYRFYIAAKTMLHLLEWQGELTKEEADTLEHRVQARVDLLLETASAKHKEHARH